MENNFSLNIIIQYSLVGIILLAIAIFLFVKILRRSKENSSGGCCGCGLAENCKKRNLNSVNNKINSDCKENKRL